MGARLDICVVERKFNHRIEVSCFLIWTLFIQIGPFIEETGAKVERATFVEVFWC